MTVIAPVAELDNRFSGPDAQPTPWGTTRGVLDSAELFWISTVRPDGRPHVTPLLGVWRDEALHFCTGASEQKAVNLAADPRCALTTGTSTWNGGLDVVVEGSARRVADQGVLEALAEAWFVKYHGDWRFEVADGVFMGAEGPALVFVVDPSKVLAFSKGRFAQTRYRF